MSTIRPALESMRPSGVDDVADGGGGYMIATGAFTLCSHLAPTAGLGANCQIWLVEWLH